MGIIGVGFLAISHANGLDQRFRGARPFYLVIIVSTVNGVVMDFLKINPVRALYWTAVINGMLAPFLMVAILLIALDRTVMKGQPSAALSAVVVSVATLLMFGAAIGMFIF